MSEHISLAQFPTGSSSTEPGRDDGPDEHVSPKVSESSQDPSRPPYVALQHHRLGEVEGYVLTEDDEAVQASLAHNFSERKKWWVLLSVCYVQISMNLNASIFGSANEDLRERFGLSWGILRAAQGSFLIAYGFGCELWAPWSEELGRWSVLQWSLGLVNLWQIPQLLAVQLAKEDSRQLVGGMIVIFRVLGGLCSAGGSVTLAVVADMWGRYEQRQPMATIVFASVAGSIVGPVIGGFLQYYSGAPWVIGVELIAGAVAQIAYFFTPETRISAILLKEAKRRRARGDMAYTQDEFDQLSPNEAAYWRNVRKIWVRPFKMLFTEPIVGFLSLISGFSDALIFTFLEALPMMLDEHNMNAWQKGLMFLPIGLGYIAGWLFWTLEIWYWSSRREMLERRPELRLLWLMIVVGLLPLSMYMMGWVATPDRHWSIYTVLLFCIGIVNYAIYGATVDYMVAAYGDNYAASATGGNGFARDILAGVSAFYAHPLFSRVGEPKMHLKYGITILATLSIPLILPIFIFFGKGEWFRARSKYAREVARTREATEPEKEPEVSSDST